MTLTPMGSSLVFAVTGPTGHPGEQGRIRVDMRMASGKCVEPMSNSAEGGDEVSSNGRYA